MKMKRILAGLVLALGSATSTWANLPDGWSDRSISDMPHDPGNVLYVSGTWTIDSPSNRFHYAYTSLQGDGQITARIVNASSMCSVRICEDLSYSSKNASMIMGQCSYQSNIECAWFHATGMSVASDTVDVGGLPYWIRLDREGNLFTGYISPSGNPGSWNKVASAQVSMGTETYIGLTVDSPISAPGSIRASGRGVFDNVTVEPLGGPVNAWKVYGNNMYVRPTGNVGIGTQNPQYKLDIRGVTATDTLVIRGGADLAEPFLITDRKETPKGALVVIDDKNPGRLKISCGEYDKCVAGVVSGAGGLKPGLTLTQKGIVEGGVKVALAGRVYALADTSNGSIKPGDMLTTSSLPGHAMKATDRDRSFGAVIGKAMSPLKKGRGLVLVLVSLQ